MGGCNSCEAAAVAPSEATSTVKLITRDGKLTEYARSVKTSQVLLKEPGCFVCNSDDMDFNDFASAVDGDEELQSGQLYFLLPVSMKRRPLEPDEIAALAVKASAVLVASGGWCYSERPASPLEFSTVRPRGCSGRVEERRRRKKPDAKSGCAGKGHKFTSNLIAIPECWQRINLMYRNQSCNSTGGRRATGWKARHGRPSQGNAIPAKTCTI